MSIMRTISFDRAHRPPSCGSHSGSTRTPGEHAVAHPPEDPEAVPLAVRRHVRVEPPQAVGDRVVVVGRRARATAACAGTRAARRRVGAISGMNCTALAPVPITATRLPREIDVVVPPRRVERRARERVAAGDVGERRPVELADRADRPRSPSIVSSPPSAVAHAHGPRARRRRTTSPTTTSVPKRMWSRSAERRRRSRGSSRAARPASRSGTASRGAARTSSCSCGSGCRRGSPG